MEKRAISYIESLPEPRGSHALVTEKELTDLPPVVQRYFRYSQVVGKPRIDSFGLVTTGRIRQSAGAKWMKVVSRQYNSLSNPARIYYIKGKGSPMSGIDSYINGAGRMHIKLFNLITVADTAGWEMDQSGLVTYLNDLAFCPPAYFSLPVGWEEIDNSHAVIAITHKGVTVRATVSFGDDGRIVDWESDDRFAEVDGRQVQDKWSTKFDEYDEIEGLRIPVSGRGIHNFDGNPFTYVEIERVSSLAWNITTLPDLPRE